MSFSIALRYSAMLAACAAVACGGSQKCSVAPDAKPNCEMNREMAQADLKACAAGGADDMCAALIDKDLKQIEALCPANQAIANDVRSKVDACKGKGAENETCKSIEASLAKFTCG